MQTWALVIQITRSSTVLVRLGHSSATRVGRRARRVLWMFRSPATRALAIWLHLREAMAPYLSRPVRALAVTESGATAVEYTVMIGGIALAIVGVVYLLGDDLAAIFQTIDTKLTSGTPT